MKKSLLFGLLLSALTLSGCLGVNQSRNVVSNIAPTQPVNVVPTEKKPAEDRTTASTWQEVTHANYWKNPKLFASSDYNFADIKFSYPTEWFFSCCADQDGKSVHTIYSSADNDEQLPFITITDYSLWGCPSSDANCSLGETVPKTPEEKYQELVSNISDKAIILPRKLLGSLGTTAYHYQVDESIFFNFQMIDPDFNYAKVDSYIIVTEKDVVEITFSKYTELPASFIDDFLQRIEKE